MNCRCIRRRYADAGAFRKIFKDNGSSTGYTGWHYGQRASMHSAARHAASSPHLHELVNCDECRHKLRCLIDQEYDIAFEGK